MSRNSKLEKNTDEEEEEINHFRCFQYVISSSCHHGSSSCRFAAYQEYLKPIAEEERKIEEAEKKFREEQERIAKQLAEGVVYELKACLCVYVCTCPSVGDEHEL
ncbi:hypothetical protein PAMA_007901 [Pampus argenteus]